LSRTKGFRKLKRMPFLAAWTFYEFPKPTGPPAPPLFLANIKDVSCNCERKND
jgi:hypothetical protein